MKSKTVLVTGGAGSIGSHVVERLISRGDIVVVVDDFNDFYDPRIKRSNVDVYRNHKNYVLYEADIRDPKLFKMVFKKHRVETVVHLAARAGVRPSIDDPQLYWSVNVMGTLNLLEAMRESRVPQLVFASSSSVYGERSGGAFIETDNTDQQISPYGASKKAKEVLTATYAHLYGIKTTGLRFFTAYGPRNRPDMACYLFVNAINKNKPIKVFGDGNTKRDYTYIGDIADGVIAAIDNPMDYELINLGNSKPVMLSKLIRTIEKELGKQAVIVSESEKPGDVPMTYADTKKAKELLGWSAKVGIDEGISKLVEWYEEKNK